MARSRSLRILASALASPCAAFHAGTATKLTASSLHVAAVQPKMAASINPYFTAVDQDACTKLIAEFCEATKTEEGCLYYEWTQAGDKIYVREAYKDGDALLAHLGNVGPILDKLLAGPAKLDRLEIVGSSAEIEKVKPATEPLGTVYFEAVESAKPLATKVVSPSCLSIHPYFSVVDQAACTKLIAEFCEATKTEEGCLYYDWAQAGDKLFVREAYKDGDALLAHLGNVGPILDKLLAGPAKLESLEIVGAGNELEKVKEATAPLGTIYYETVGSI